MGLFNFFRKKKDDTAWDFSRLNGDIIDICPQGGVPFSGKVSHVDGKILRIILDDGVRPQPGTTLDCFVKFSGHTNGEFLMFRATAGVIRFAEECATIDISAESKPVPGQKRSFFRVSMTGSMMAFVSAWLIDEDVQMPDTSEDMKTIRTQEPLQRPFVEDISGAGIALRFTERPKNLDIGSRVICLVSCIGVGPDVQFWADCHVTGERKKNDDTIYGLRFDRWANAEGKILSWFHCTSGAGVTPVNRWALDAERMKVKFS